MVTGCLMAVSKSLFLTAVPKECPDTQKVPTQVCKIISDGLKIDMTRKRPKINKTLF